MSVSNDGAKQNQEAVLTIDSRKFLGAINGSAQAKLSFIESRIREMGKAAGANWRLVCLRGDDLFIEDVSAHQYMVADHRREKGGRTVIDNLRPMRIVESKKKSLFEASCIQLLNAIEENDQKEMQTAFGKMAGQRFSSRVVPFSGRVRTHDGQIRHIHVANDAVVDESIRSRLVAAVIEGITNQVVVREGRVVSGAFNPPIKLPISEWTCRKAIVKQMRSVAESAYWSPGFQERIYSTARLVYDDKVVEGVKAVSNFLIENQEFTLLNRDQTKRLIENALAAKACFNQQLCNDVATLFWRTNLKINKRTIIDEWRSVAKKAGHPTLLENVRLLEESRNFEAAYDQFINLVFNEAAGPKEVQVGAYKTALQALRDTPKIKGSGDLTTKIDELIERLDQPETDHAVISEVEDLLAEVKNEMNALDNLQNFDQMPGGAAQSAPPLADASGPIVDPAAGAGGNKGGANVTFNINIGKDGDVAAGEDDEAEDDELDKLLADAPAPDAAAGGVAAPAAAPGATPGAAAPGGGALSKLLGGESHDRKGDPYAISEDDRVSFHPRMGSDYGMKPIDVHEDCMRAVQAMFGIAQRDGLVGAAVGESLEALADAGIQQAGLRIPGRKKDAAVDQVCEAFIDECGRRATLGEDQYKWSWSYKGGKRKSTYGNGKKSTSEGAGGRGRPVSEGTPPWLAGRDNPKDRPHRDDHPSEYEAVEGRQCQECGTKLNKSGECPACDGEAPERNGRADGRRNEGLERSGLRWLERQDDGILGNYRNVNFLFDHGGDSQLEPVIMSEDGQIEVPVPAELYDSAFAAAKMTAGDSKPFMEWLDANIVQFQSADVENQALNEAMATIKTGPDGTVTVEVDSEDPAVTVSEPGGEGEEEVGVGGGAAVGSEEGMQPVGAMDGETDGDGGAQAVGDNEMPNFDDEEMPGVGEQEIEAGEQEIEAGEQEIEAGEEEIEAGEQDAGFPPKRKKGPPVGELGEDDDITEPRSKKYTAKVRENPRDQPKHPPLPPDADDKLKGVSSGGGAKSDVSGGVKMKKVKPRGS